MELLETQGNRDSLIRLSHFFKHCERGLYPTGESELHIASYNDLPWLVKWYLSQGVNPNSVADCRDTPLIWGSEMGSLACVAELLKGGSDPNIMEYDGWTELHWAARNGHLRVCELLLEYGAKTDAMDDHGLTPLDWAISCGYPSVIAALRNASADLNASLGVKDALS
jgi:ankyrin repeat protein